MKYMFEHHKKHFGVLFMKKVITFLIILVSFASYTHAQEDTTYTHLKEKIEEIKGALEGLNETYLETKSTVDALKKIKLSGYIQNSIPIG